MTDIDLNANKTDENKVDFSFNYDQEEVFQPLDELKQFNTKPRPFLVVLTSGLEHLETIKHELTVAGIEIESEYIIEDFEVFARHIYPIIPDKPHSHLWLMLNRKFYNDNPQGVALMLPYELIEEYERIAQTKRHIRNVIGIQDYQIAFKGQITKISFHHLHAPDIDELSYQYNCLLNFTNFLLEP